MISIDVNAIYSVDEVVSLLGLTEYTVHKLCRNGAISAKKNGKFWSISGVALKAYFDRNTLNRALYDLAVSAYQRYCDEHALIFQQPSPDDSSEGRKYLYLKNAYGLLATYNKQTGAVKI